MRIKASETDERYPRALLLYTEMELTTTEIAERTGLSRDAILRYLKSEGIYVHPDRGQYAAREAAERAREERTREREERTRAAQEQTEEKGPTAEPVLATVTPIRRARSTSWRGQVEGATDIGPVSEFLSRFEIHLRAVGRSEKTIDRYLRAARQLEGWLGGSGIAALARTDMEAYIVARRDATSASTAATDFVSLQQFFKFVKLDLSSGGSGFTSPMEGMSAPRFVAPVIKVVPDEFLAALIRQAEDGTYSAADHVDRTFEDTRDAALLRMFVDTGARLSEITNLSLAEIINAPRITVYGKSKGHGPVPREVEVGERALRALRRYLRARQQHPDASSGVLWLGQRGPLTPNGVRQMLKKRSRAIGMHVHPHQLRHTKADDYLANGGSEGDLMKLMGWRSDTMPKRYGADRAATRALEAQRAMGFPGDRI